MGEYFYYANHDRKLKFEIGLVANAIKFSGIGRGLGARAFCLLLTESKHRQKVYRKTLIGSWVGDFVSCIGDETKWHYEESSYQDITANIIVMLYQIDGEEKLIEVATRDEHFFVQIAYLIFTNQFTDLLPEFERCFGKEWTKKYKAIVEEHSYYAVRDLVLL